MQLTLLGQVCSCRGLPDLKFSGSSCIIRKRCTDTRWYAHIIRILPNISKTWSTQHFSFLFLFSYLFQRNWSAGGPRNIPMVIGLVDAGRFDQVYAVLLLFVNCGMQIMFSGFSAAREGLFGVSKWRTPKRLVLLIRLTMDDLKPPFLWTGSLGRTNRTDYVRE